MIRDCKAYGLPDVEFIDFESAIRINMYRKTTQGTIQGSKTTQITTQGATQTEKTTQATTRCDLGALKPNDRQVLKLIQAHPRMTQKEFAEVLGWKVDRVKYYFKNLRLFTRKCG